MGDQNSGHARLRHTATGALAALAAVGAIAGTAALAAKPHAKAPPHAAAANGGATKTPTSPVPGKTQAPQPAVNHQPFFNAVQRLVDNGTITAAQGQAVDREIQAGRVDTNTFTGFTQAQIQSVEQALGNAKRALVPGVTGGPDAGNGPRAAPDKAHARAPSPNPQPFLNAVQRLVDTGTITATQGQAVDREIRAGRIDTDTLASRGFTSTQLQAVEQALGNVKRGL